MGWIKKPPPSPVDLGTRHLDDVIKPNDYTQIYAGRATKAQGYPFEGLAGVLEIKAWNVSNGAVIAIYTSWSGGIAKRTWYQGAWRPWVDPMGKAVT